MGVWVVGPVAGGMGAGLDWPGVGLGRGAGPLPVLPLVLILLLPPPLSLTPLALRGLGVLLLLIMLLLECRKELLESTEVHHHVGRQEGVVMWLAEEVHGLECLELLAVPWVEEIQTLQRVLALLMHLLIVIYIPVVAQGVLQEVLSWRRLDTFIIN